MQRAVRREPWVEMLGRLVSTLRPSARCSLRLSSVSRPALVSASSLLNASNLGQPLVVEFARARQNEKHGIFTHLVAAWLRRCSCRRRRSAWARKERRTQSEGLPHLARMARQFLGRPATSAGVERMFSLAGKLHDDMKKSQQDDTLEHSLFAAANTE